MFTVPGSGSFFLTCVDEEGRRWSFLVLRCLDSGFLTDWACKISERNQLIGC